jgi:two-component system, LytTR family, response regulator
MSSIRVLIVDDEPIARKGIRRLLDEASDVEIVGECGDGAEAALAIRKQSPDLVFLDVQMPELDGFGMLEKVGVEAGPEIIFVTAYDEYTLRAFDIQALDYLLKPVNPERFHKALGRARARLQNKSYERMNGRLLALLENQRREERGAARFAVKTPQGVLLVDADDVDLIEAAGNYVSLRAGSQAHLLSETISGMERRLDPRKFLRIHRSRIVNMERIKLLRPLFHGEYEIVLKDGTRLTSGRAYSGRIRERLGL